MIALRGGSAGGTDAREFTGKVSTVWESDLESQVPLPLGGIV